MKTFHEELDALLLADLLHNKQCNKEHSINPTWAMHDHETYCNYHNHARELEKQVKQATINQKYHQKAKDILSMCDNMNMRQIIALVNTIME